MSQIGKHLYELQQEGDGDVKIVTLEGDMRQETWWHGSVLKIAGYFKGLLTHNMKERLVDQGSDRKSRTSSHHSRNEGTEMVNMVSNAGVGAINTAGDAVAGQLGRFIPTMEHHNEPPKYQTLKS